MIGRHRCVAMTTKASLWYSNGLLWINERPVAHPDWPHQRKVMQRDAISIPDTRPFLLEKFFSICHPHLKPVTDRKNVIIPSFFWSQMFTVFFLLWLFFKYRSKRSARSTLVLWTYGKEHFEDAVHVLKAGLAPIVLSPRTKVRWYSRERIHFRFPSSAPFLLPHIHGKWHNRLFPHIKESDLKSSLHLLSSVRTLQLL